MGQSLSITAIMVSIYNVNGYPVAQRAQARNLLTENPYLIPKPDGKRRSIPAADHGIGEEMPLIGKRGILRPIQMSEPSIDRLDKVIISEIDHAFHSVTPDVLRAIVTWYQDFQQVRIAMHTNPDPSDTASVHSLRRRLQSRFKNLRFHPVMIRIIQKILQSTDHNAKTLVNTVAFVSQINKGRNHNYNFHDTESMLAEFGIDEMQAMSALESLNIDEYRIMTLIESLSQNMVQSRYPCPQFVVSAFYYHEIYGIADGMELVPSEGDIQELKDQHSEDIKAFNNKWYATIYKYGTQYLFFDDGFLLRESRRIDGVDNADDFYAMIDAMMLVQQKNPGIEYYPEFQFDLLINLLRNPRLKFSFEERMPVATAKYLQKILIEYFNCSIEAGTLAKEMGTHLTQKGIFEYVIYIQNSELNSDKQRRVANWYLPSNRS